MTRLATIAFAASVAACAAPRFLGEPLPPSCARSSSACEDALVQREWQMNCSEGDPALLAYVRGVVARLLPFTALREPPEVALVCNDASASVSGRTIDLDVRVIERFDSEAELAFVLAHELAHLEAGVSDGWSSDTGWTDEDRRDMESVADERAVELLARAGYPPAAAATALARLGPANPNDATHPPRAERVRRIRALAAQLGSGGDDRRAALLAAIDGEPTDPNVAFLDGPTGDHVVLGRAGLAWRLVPDPQRFALHVSPCARAVGESLAGTLGEPSVRHLAVGDAVVGRVRPFPGGDSLARVLHDVGATPEPFVDRVWVAVVITARGAAFAYTNDPDDAASVEAWLAALHRPTADELRMSSPRHVRIHRADHAAPLILQLDACPDPKLAAQLDGGERIVATGEPFKCTER